MTKRGLSFVQCLSFLSHSSFRWRTKCSIHPHSSLYWRKKNTCKDLNVWLAVREELPSGKEDDNAGDELTEEMH